MQHDVNESRAEILEARGTVQYSNQVEFLTRLLRLYRERVDANAFMLPDPSIAHAYFMHGWTPEEAAEVMGW